MKPVDMTVGQMDFIQSPTGLKREDAKNFGDHLIELKGKLLEIFIGEEYQTREYDDYSVAENSSTFGRLVDVFDRFIVLDCLYVADNGDIRTGNRVYINAFQIRAMTLLNKQGGLEDIFLSNKDAGRIRKMLTTDNEVPDTNRY